MRSVRSDHHETRKDNYMRALLIVAVIIGAMARQLHAQSNFLESVSVLSPGRIVLVPMAWNPSWSGDTSSCGRPQWGYNKFPSWGYACDPYYASYGNGDPAPSLTITMPQVVAPQPPAPPPPPVRAEVREYYWPSTRGDSSATTFSIISKDGLVEFATVVWVQDDKLYYVTPDGGQRRAPIVSIDRDATRQRNAEKQLSFWLPPENKTQNTAHLELGGVSLTSEER